MPRRATGSSRGPQLHQCLACPGEELLLVRVPARHEWWAEDAAAEHRHRQYFALWQDAVHIFQVHRNQLGVWPQPRQVIEPALERAELAAPAACAFGEENQRVAIAHVD